MTRIANHADCAHQWAAQSRDSGKSGPLWFQGRTIYSYGEHYPIASFTDATANGERVVLFNSIGSTQTTEGKHKTAVRRALYGRAVRVFDVPTPRAIGVAAHRDNLDALVERFHDAIASASRARTYGAMHIESADRARADAIAYAEAFQLSPPELPEISPELMAGAKARLQQAKALNAERERQKLAEWCERADRWQRGENVSLHTAGMSHTAVATRLRLIDDGATIETSRGARVPVSVAARLWELACECREAGKPATMRSGWRVGAYELDSVTAMGALKIGCHTLEFPELLRMARILRLPIPETAEA